MVGCAVGTLLAVAQGELGTVENPRGSNKVKYNDWYYGRAVEGDSYPWCMAFVQWVFHQAGMEMPIKTASCGALMRAAKAAGQWVIGDYRPGDVVIYDFPGGAPTDHCGICESVDGGEVTTIEGNTSVTNASNGGEVRRMIRPIDRVVGAWRPNYIAEEEKNVDLELFKQLWQEMRKELQDNDSSEYSAEAREWAVNNGLVAGGSSAEFNGMWEDVMTREQFVTVLFRFAKLVGLK